MDNIEVYNAGETCFVGTRFWIHVSKKMQREQDGRAIWTKWRLASLASTWTTPRIA